MTCLKLSSLVSNSME